MFDHKVMKICGGLLLVLLFAFFMKPGDAKASDFHNFSLIQTVYDVSVNGTEIGTVKNKQVVKEIIDDKLTEAELAHPGLAFAVVQDVTFQKRKVFRPHLDVQKTLDELKQELTVKVKALELRVGDKTIGYVKNKDVGEAIIRQYESQYISDVILNQLNGTDNPTQVMLKDGTAILDVSLSKEVSYVEAEVSPADILSVSDGVELLSQGTIQTQSYQIEKGDVLSSIADKFNLSIDTLKQLNPEISKTSVLQVGDELKVTAPKPFVDVIEQKTVTEKQEIPYDTKVKKDDSMFKGQSKVLNAGKPGLEKIRYLLTLKDGIVTNKEVDQKTILVKPTTKVVVKGTKIIPSRGTGEFAWPTVGGVVTSRMGMRWGAFHKGVDIAGVSNPAILAADNGVVIYAQWNNGGYGNRVIINHNNGFKTTYNHMSKILVHVGQVVQKGQQIGVMGETGDATGVHLHFELYHNGHLVHPLRYIHR
ncbi:MAG TPA: peptidoglycan DD-metalloendopeptidase family protein [Bacillales bacterium]|nr:peptidoglycan DD-metalloendopeptidase family protein [Bacillales bacterium]